MVHSGYMHEAEVQSALLRAESALSPDVVRIRYSFDEDWTGEPSIFFRILLSDKASRPKNLGEVARRIRSVVRDEVNPDKFDLHSFFSFRSESEQSEVNDPDWA